MFNLEESVVNWRQQMLAAGIGSPVPLEELELHLREEIDQRIKSGLSIEDATKAAIVQFGEASVLRNEFKNAGVGRSLSRKALLISGWLAANFILFYFLMGLDFNWNLFNFSATWNQSAVVEIFGIVVAAAALWALAKTGRDKTCRAAMLLIALLMALMAVRTLPPESIPSPAPLVVNPGEDPAHALAGAALHRALQRHEPSPLWFRGSQTLLQCLPLMIWIGWKMRRDILNKQYDQP